MIFPRHHVPITRDQSHPWLLSLLLYKIDEIKDRGGANDARGSVVSFIASWNDE